MPQALKIYKDLIKNLYFKKIDAIRDRRDKKNVAIVANGDNVKNTSISAAIKASIWPTYQTFALSSAIRSVDRGSFPK